MPYELKRKGNRYQVVDTDTGKVRVTTTKAKATKQLAMLSVVERDWTPTGDGSYTRTINGKPHTLHIK